MLRFEAQGIQKRFEGVVALKNACLKLEGSKVFGLVGANGSGKTTFARICAGLVRKDCGTISINQQTVEINSPIEANAMGIGLAHQNLSLVPDLTVWENIMLGHEQVRRGVFLDNEWDRGEARCILEELVPGEIHLDIQVKDLRPAQKQIVEIAKVLSRHPKLLILDEPTAALEYNHVEQLFKKIEELKRQGVTIVFISHRLWEIVRICDIVFAFRNGEYVGMVDFEQQPREEAPIVPLITGDEARHTLDFGRKPHSDFTGTPVTLELAGVSDGGFLKGISFQASQGEVVGIGGLNGQGQEELIEVLAGVRPVRSGTIKVLGEPVKLLHPKHAMNKGIYLVPGDRMVEGLFPTHTIIKNLVFPRLALKQEKFYLNRQRMSAISDDIISKVELRPPDKNLTVNILSGGNQQKVVFGRWLQFKPTLLLLNDPAKGIDIQAKSALYALTHQLAREGTTVILYASSYEELINHCDRVLIIFEGRIVDELDYQQINENTLIKKSLRFQEAGENL